MFHDSVTTQIRQSYECSADSARIKNMVRFSYDIYKNVVGNRQESVKNTPEASTKHL